jgi:hypothetical protein
MVESPLEGDKVVDMNFTTLGRNTHCLMESFFLQLPLFPISLGFILSSPMETNLQFFSLLLVVAGWET